MERSSFRGAKALLSLPLAANSICTLIHGIVAACEVGRRLVCSARLGACLCLCHVRNCPAAGRKVLWFRACGLCSCHCPTNRTLVVVANYILRIPFATALRSLHPVSKCCDRYPQLTVVPCLADSLQTEEFYVIMWESPKE